MRVQVCNVQPRHHVTAHKWGAARDDDSSSYGMGKVEQAESHEWLRAGARKRSEQTSKGGNGQGLWLAAMFSSNSRTNPKLTRSTAHRRTGRSSCCLMNRCECRRAHQSLRHLRTPRCGSIRWRRAEAARCGNPFHTTFVPWFQPLGPALLTAHHSTSTQPQSAGFRLSMLDVEGRGRRLRPHGVA